MNEINLKDYEFVQQKISEDVLSPNQAIHVNNVLPNLMKQYSSMKWILYDDENTSKGYLKLSEHEDILIDDCKIIPTLTKGDILNAIPKSYYSQNNKYLFELTVEYNAEDDVWSIGYIDKKLNKKDASTWFSNVKLINAMYFLLFYIYFIRNIDNTTTTKM